MIYLDYHAATPLCDAARVAMEGAASVAWANPSSAHAAGRASRRILEDARRAIATSVGADPSEVILTSGGTEACDLGIRGLGADRVHVHPWAHPAVVSAAEGRTTSFDLGAIRSGDLVAFPWVDHETGARTDAQGVVRACRSAGAASFVDATQAFGRLALDFHALDADVMALASHKVGGPAGIGALVVRRGVSLTPTLSGGGQERGRRGGTPSVHAAAGFGAAASVIAERVASMPRIATWRDAIEGAFVEHGARVNSADARVASASNVSVPGWRSSVLVAALDVEGVMISAGAACSSGVDAPSPIISAMHPDDPERAASAVRISLGPEGLDRAAVEHAIALIHRVLSRPG